MTKEEIWKPIKGYEGFYEVSNLGRVKSLAYSGGERINRKEIILKSSMSGPKMNYPNIRLYINGKKKIFRIHDLVAEAFIGKKEEWMTVDHIDENTSNNNLENLEYVTQRENSARYHKGRSSSIYTGVYWDKSKNKWRAAIRIRDKKNYLGTFDYELDAKESYDKALRDHLNE